MSELILTEKATATTPAAGKGTVYLKPGGGLYIKDSTGAEAPLGTAGGGGGGVTDHGALTGLGDDDHTQYLNNARGDARYDALGTSATHSGNTANPHSVTKAQVGLANVDNTSDLNKPISTATQSALDAKQATLVSATNIKTINGASVLGSGDLVVSGTGGVTDHGALTGLGDDDHTQYHTDARGDARYEALGAVAAHAGTGGTAHANAVASGAAGFMTGADKAKLDGVAAGANNYTHPANHPASIITQDSSNRFVTDAEKAAWDAKQAALGYTAESTASKDASGGYAGLTLFKLNLHNAANTVTSWFTTAATAARTWTMPDKDGTVAMTSDITGTNSGTNTGDNAVNSLYSGLVTNATHTGDATGSDALTVVAINGTNMAGLATGILKNTTGTGVPSIAAAGTDYVTPAGAETLSAKTLTGYTETVYALTGTTPAFSEANGSIQTWALSGASTPTDSLTTGQSLILVITPGAYAITWPSVTWTKVGGSGAAPTLYSAGKTNVILWKVGSTLYGSHLGDA